MFNLNFSDRIGILFVFLCLILGCTVSPSDLSEDSVVRRFSKTPSAINLQSREKSIESIYPTEIKQIDDFLFVTDLKSKAGMVIIYDTKSEQVLRTCIPQGEGSHELTAVSSIYKVRDSIFFFDPQSLRLLGGLFDELINNRNYHPVYLRKLLFSDFERPLYLFPYSSDSIFAHVIPGFQGRFIKLDQHYEPVGRYFAPFPELDFREEEMTKMSLYVKVLGNLFYTTSVSDSNVIIMSYNYVDMIDIFDVHTGNLLKRIIGPEQNFPPKYILNQRLQAAPCLECSCGYSNPIITTKGFMVLRLNKLYSDSDALTSKFIYYFNWDGALTQTIKLDKDVSQFVIDEQNKKIYAISLDTDYPLLEFNFSIKVPINQ